MCAVGLDRRIDEVPTLMYKTWPSCHGSRSHKNVRFYGSSRGLAPSWWEISLDIPGGAIALPLLRSSSNSSRNPSHRSGASIGVYKRAKRSLALIAAHGDGESLLRLWSRV